MQIAPINCGEKILAKAEFYNRVVNRESVKTLKDRNSYMDCMAEQGAFGTDLEISIASLVDWPISNGKTIRLNFHIIKKAQDSENYVLYTSYITNAGVSDVLIYHTGRVQVGAEDNTTGNHYQAFIPKEGNQFETGRVPFINWQFFEKQLHLSDVNKKDEPEPLSTPPLAHLPTPPPPAPLAPPSTAPLASPPTGPFAPPPSEPLAPSLTEPLVPSLTEPLASAELPYTPPKFISSDGPSCAPAREPAATSSSLPISTIIDKSNSQMDGGIRPRQARILKKDTKKKSKISKKSSNKSKKR